MLKRIRYEIVGRRGMPVAMTGSGSGKPGLVSRRSVVMGLCLGGLSPTLAQAALDMSEAGSVTSVSGQAIGRLGPVERPLVDGGPVFLGDTLRTGADARLSARLGTETELSLGAQCRLRIDKFLVDRGGKLTLTRGAMLFERPDDGLSGPLEVVTPFGLIAARGTKFFAGPSEGAFGVYVDHGVVVVRTRAGVVQLGEGLGTRITDINAPPTAAKAWSRAAVASALASVS
jgi:ferric-dicitrate binding protein FerR (iron transport regulator)